MSNLFHHFSQRSKQQKVSFGILVALLAMCFVPSLDAAAVVVNQLDLVILVDESASLTSSDVRDEVRAVQSLVARRELSGSDLTVRIAIAGFGSGENAVDEKCPLQVVSTANVADFVRCAEQVSRRSSSGQHTDFAKAFDYASSVFNSKSEPSVGRAVILLTDGKYDPFGKLKTVGLTAADASELESATTSLREDGAQIWPLGFGQVSEDELNDLAKNGSSSLCQAGRQPYAIIDQGASLGDYLLEILGGIICTRAGAVTELPYDLPVHPLVNEVTLTVRSTSVDPKVIVKASEKELCQGDWKKANDGSLSCVVTVSGEDTGIWTITTTDSGTGVNKPTVEASQKGRIDLRFDKCDESGAVVNVARIDQTLINWVADGNPEFPNAEFSAPSLNLQLGLTRLSNNQVSINWENVPDAQSEVFVKLAAGQDDFVWLTASEDKCVIEAKSGSSSTVVSPGTTVVGTSDGDNGGGGGPPWVWILLLVGLAALVGWLLKKKFDKAKFPVGSEFRQRNISQNPAAKWNTRADIGGQKKVKFIFDQNGWLVETDSDDADLILQRGKKSSEGDFLVTQPPQSGADIISTAGTELTYTFSIQGELGGGIPFKGTFVGVEVPAEIEDEEDQDEE